MSMQVIKDLSQLDEPLVRTVLTIGNFDGVHLGHREIFRRVVNKASELDGTSVVVTFEPHPLRLLAPEKAPLRLNTPEENIRLIGASCIDILVVLNFDLWLAEMSAEAFVRDILVGQLGLTHLIVGYDYAFGRDRRGDTAFLTSQAALHGFTLDVLEPVDIWCAEVLDWNRLMQHPQFELLDCVQEVETGAGTTYRTTVCPIRIDGRKPTSRLGSNAHLTTRSSSNQTIA